MNFEIVGLLCGAKKEGWKEKREEWGDSGWEVRGRREKNVPVSPTVLATPPVAVPTVLAKPPRRPSLVSLFGENF